MRNVAPYEGNPIIEFLMQFSFFSILFFIIAALVFLFIVISFFGFALPEIFGGKDIIEHLEAKRIKKEADKNDFQIRLEQKRVQEQTIFRERSRRLHEEAKRKVLTHGYTEEQFYKFLNSPAFEKMDEETKKKVRESIKNLVKEKNQEIYEAYVLHNQASLIDFDKFLKP